MCAANGESLHVSYLHLSDPEQMLAIWVADAPTEMLAAFDEALKVGVCVLCCAVLCARVMCGGTHRVLSIACTSTTRIFVPICTCVSPTCLSATGVCAAWCGRM
jgi:hypothetical protein